MAETKSLDEPTLHTKRKPDINGEDSQEHPSKVQKLETLDDNSLAPLDEAKKSEASLKSGNNFEVPNSNCSAVTEREVEKVESDLVAEDIGDEDGEDGGEFDRGGVDDDGDEDEDEDGDESNGEAEVDRKGKGIMRTDKGKGKLIEDDDDSGDDDDSSVDGVVSDGESDLSDDPLAEVDLNNILPSRTRRRTIHPGEYIANDLGNDDEDDDSDDSDV